MAAAEHAYRQDLTGALAHDKDRSAFLAALSHELRTPLNAILGFSDILLSELDGPLSDDARENLEVVHQSGEHLRSLINDILDLSALESREIRLKFHSLDLQKVAEEVVRELRLTAEGKGLQLRLEGGAAVAWGDALRVRQVIGNIVSNAVKFTSEGEVVVQVETQADTAVVVVRDTGPGIAKNDQDTIFEEYRQSGAVHAQRTGTGLGLAITRRLVQLHGGSIHVDSELGQGSRFTVVFPSQPPIATSLPSDECLSVSSSYVPPTRSRAI